MNQVDLGPLVERWRRRCALAGDDGTTWPEAESALLIQSVLATRQSSSSPEQEPTEIGPKQAAHSSALDRATRSWARTQPSLSALTLRLRGLREAIAADASEDREAGHSAKVCGVVEATATEEFTLRLQRAALTDPLTGVGNRRALDNAWQAAVSQGKRLGQPVCLVGIDLDGLKRINDFQGHAAGDDAIVRLCAALRAALRDTDDIFRIGGDEFIALLPGTAAEAAAELAGRVQQYHAPKFSWGAADTMQDGATLDDVLRCADRRLYAQRRRDRSATASVSVTVATPEPSLWSRVTARRALELGASGALALAIGAIVVSISGGNHALCAGGDGPTIVDCGLSNAVYYGGIVLAVAGAIVLGVGVVVAALLRGTKQT
jgi:diguanylate cyclase (GGDEF)-like protein